MWGTILLLFSVPIISYTTTPLVAWLVLYGSIGSTALGCLIARHVTAHGRGMPTQSSAAKLLVARIRLDRLRLAWLVSAVLGVVGFAAFVYAVDKELGWSAVFTNGEGVREVKRDSAVFQEAYGPWKLLTNFNQVAFILWTVGLRSGAFGGRWRWAYVAGVGSLLPFLFTADRGLLVSLVMWAAVLHLLWPSTPSWRRVALVGVVGVLVAGIGITAIGNRYGGSLAAHPEVAKQAMSPIDALVIPYLYLTANIPTFGQLTQDGLAPTTSGQMTVLPLIKAVHAVGAPGESPVGTGVFYSIPFQSFSNYGWLGSFWLDLRAPGVLLLSALVGFLASLSRAKLARAPSVAGLWIASLFLYVIVLSPFANALTATLFWQYLLLTPFVAALLDRDAGRRYAEWLSAPRRRVVTACGVATLLLVATAALLFMRSRDEKRQFNVIAELGLAIRKAQYVHSEEGRYPEPLALTTRLQVNRPEVSFLAQSAYSEELPPAGTIAVYSGPSDVFVRVRDRDGRVFEAHRTEAFGGVTFGPGTRD